jgi:hypothetical protein
MKRSYKLAAAVAAALGLGISAAALAEPQHMGEGHGAHGMGGMRHGQGLMSAEERSALQEKMRNAKTPEDRHNLADATHAEMQKRAKEKGTTLPQHGGPAHTH